jgi:pheromone shutdown-related protein TraB
VAPDGVLPDQSLEEKLPKAVTILERGDSRIYVLGTAHVSSSSVQDVEEVVRVVQPDVIVVELCESRFEAMSNPDRWKKMDVFKVVREGKGMLLLVNLLLSSFQRRIGDQLGVKPGAEMMRAVELAKESGAEMVLGDRDVQVTLKRTWAGLGAWEKIKLLSSLFGSVFVGDEEVDEAELEKLKEGDVLSSMLEEVGQSYPAIKRRLIDERDLWLMNSAYSAPGDRVVVVVGAGHVPGMVKHWGDPVDTDDLVGVESKKKWLGPMIKWGIPLVICFGLGGCQHLVFGQWNLVCHWCGFGHGASLDGVVCVCGSAFYLSESGRGCRLGLGADGGVLEKANRRRL